MIIDATLTESTTTFKANLGECHNISDGGYERGYGEGYEKGNADGYSKGETDGRESGYADGYSKGETDGKEAGYKEGYDQAIEDSQAEIEKANEQWNGYWLNAATHHDLPDGLTTIPQRAFYGHDKLETINIPDTVTTIDSYAFRGCSKLGLEKLPSNLEFINSQAFYSCYELCENLEIPSGVKTIGSNAFQLCHVLTVTFKGTPTSIGNSVFSQGSSGHRVNVLNVPWAEGEVAGAPWGATYATINYNYKGE